MNSPAKFNVDIAQIRNHYDRLSFWYRTYAPSQFLSCLAFIITTQLNELPCLGSIYTIFIIHLSDFIVIRKLEGHEKTMMIHSRTALAERFFSGNSATYEHIACISTLGLDRRWKRKILNKIPQNPTQIIDQACGTGLLTFKIARRFPLCRIVGVDLQGEYLGIAKKKAEALQLTTVEFIHGKAEDVVLEGDFDCITSCYLAKYADLGLLVDHAHDMLREGGMFIMHELTYPTRLTYAFFWNIHFKLLQAYGKWKHPEWGIAFHELPIYLKETMWIDELIEALKANSFSDINIEYLAFGASAIVSARK